MAEKKVKVKYVGLQVTHDEKTGFFLTNPKDSRRCSFGSAASVEVAGIDVTSGICSRCGNRVEIVNVHKEFDSFVD